MAGLQFNLNGGTGQQRQWFDDAIRVFKFPFSRLPNHTTQVHWVEEPPLPGHSEFAATVWTWAGAGEDRALNQSDIYIRNNLDDPDRDPQKRFDGKLFYMECVAHEVGHVIQAFLKPSNVAFVAEEVFDRTVAEWNPPDAVWEARLQESFAETIKDAYMPRTHRDYDNRTYTRVPRNKWPIFCDAIELVVCPGGEPGGNF